MTKTEKKVPESDEFIFTDTGFGVKGLSKETIRKNLPTFKRIAEEGELVRQRKEALMKDRLQEEELARQERALRLEQIEAERKKLRSGRKGGGRG